MYVNIEASESRFFYHISIKEYENMAKILLDIAKEHLHEYDSPVVAAVIDGEVHDLQSSYDERGDIKFIELNSRLGWRIYRRSVLFLLIVAVNELRGFFVRYSVLIRISTNSLSEK